MYILTKHDSFNTGGYSIHSTKIHFPNPCDGVIATVSCHLEGNGVREEMEIKEG
jgi:hypothetical protein